MQFKQTAHNYVHKGWCSQAPDLTIPGQSHGLRVIIERFQRGQGVQTFPAVYNPDFPPDYDRLDKIGKIEAAREQAQVVRRMRAQLQHEEAQAKAVAKAKADEEAAKAASEPPAGQ